MNLEELGVEIRKRRRELNINQVDLSELSGVSLHTISDIETGKRNPTLSLMNQIGDILGFQVQLENKKPQ